jgi:hypothetical protein
MICSPVWNLAGKVRPSSETTVADGQAAAGGVVRGHLGAVVPKLEPVIVIVGEATPGPLVLLKDTDERLCRDADAGAALAANAGTVATAEAAVAATSTAAVGRHRVGLWLAGGLLIMAGS